MPAKITVVIPIHNEAEVIGQVLTEITASGHYTNIVIDDGSQDDSYVLASIHGALVLRHRINRGKGAAVKTGIMAVTRLDAAMPNSALNSPTKWYIAAGSVRISGLVTIVRDSNSSFQ